MSLPRPVKGTLGFIAANCFLLIMLLAGVGTFLACGAAIEHLFTEPDEAPWAWAIAVVLAIAAIGFSGLWLHRLITWALRYRPFSRSRSGARSGAA